MYREMKCILQEWMLNVEENLILEGKSGLPILENREKELIKILLEKGEDLVESLEEMIEIIETCAEV